MNIKKNYLSYTLLTNSLVSTSYNFFLIKKIFYILKFFLPQEIISKFFKVKFLFNLIFFYFIKVDENIVLDTLQKINPLIQINLPIKITNIKLKTTKIKIICLGEIPVLNINSFLILNGLKRSLVSVIKKNLGVYFFRRYKGNKIIYIAQLILSDIEIVSLEIDNLGFVSIFSTLTSKIDFFIFLNFLGIDNNYIINFSKYGHKYNLKNSLFLSLQGYKILENKLSFHNYLRNLKILRTSLSLLNTNSNLFYLKVLKKSFLNFNINKKQLKSKSFNFFFNEIIFLAIELLKIYDLLIDFKFNKFLYQDLDHIGNKKLESFGKFINKQINLAFFRNCKIFSKNFLSIKNFKKQNYKFKISKNFITLKEQINVNSLIQYLEQTNLLAENMHKSRITHINQNSLKKRGNIILRDIRTSQLGKFCVINTTEGEKSGLVISLAINSIQNKKGALKSPFYVHKKNFLYPIFLESFEQEFYQISLGEKNCRKNFFFDNYSSIILEKGEFRNKKVLEKNFLYLKLCDLLSLGENMIPFLNYNDPTRCLMGSKMQVQSVPVLFKNKPYILTGTEVLLVNNKFKSIVSISEGVVCYISSYKLIIRDIFNREIIYFLSKYKFSNQGIILNLKPVVWVGERVFPGQNLAVNLDINDSEFNIGNNISVAYGSFFGFEFEDSIIINKDIIYNNIFTSLHIENFESFLNSSIDTLDYSTIKLPKYNEYVLRNLDVFGFIKEGSKVLGNDVILSKLKLKIILFETPIYKFIFLLLGKNVRTVEDNSLVLPIGFEGRIIKLEILKTKNFLKLRIFIVRLNLLQCGDKLCGRHGNKGIVSLVTEPANLPYNCDGFYPDLITGPLGVPSRMNLGQVYESLLGISSFFLDQRVLVRPEIDSFFGINFTKAYIYKNLIKSKETSGLFSFYNPYISGQVFIRDGFTGSNLRGSLLVGNAYYSKLIHMVKQKIHSRTTGSYSEITQQPLKGRSKGGGQKFGEMEVWALEAFGAAYNLREILGYKSDSFAGRSNLSKYLFKDEILKLPSVPEVFKLTIRELNGLSLNINSFVLSNYLYGKKLFLNLIFPKNEFE